MYKATFIGGIVGVFMIVVAIVAFSPLTSVGSAPSGLATNFSSTTPVSVNTTAKTVVATSTNCAARVVSTNGSAVKLVIGDEDGDVPSATDGLVQTASTTVAYDGGIYGCGAIKAYSFGSQTITVKETR